MRELAEDLKTTVNSAEAELRRIGDEASARRPVPEKWSPREVLGHLIDSAVNNHGRFVRAAIGEDLIFPGYDQNAWVAVQDYQHRDWRELIDLWSSYNRHISSVIAAIPDEAMSRPRPKHNFHQIAWKTIPESEPATLEYFVRDYIAHLKHHLRQVSEIVESAD